MKTYRPHRFPPLSVGTRADGASVSSHASAAEGFQQGMAQGYAEGHASGLADGQAQGHREGYQDGLRQGLEEGRRQAAQAFERVAEPLEAVLAELTELNVEHQLAQRKELIDLVERVARQVIRCELTQQPQQIMALVSEAIAAMPPTRKRIEVHLNPDDLQRIRDLDLKHSSRWSLMADPRLESGECHVSAGDHEADAGCQQRLAACMQQLQSQLLDAPGAHLQVVGEQPMQEAA